MVEINAVTAIIGLLLILVGPASGIWSGLKINTVTQRLDMMAKSWDEDHKDIRSWLKGLQAEVKDNNSDISGIKAVMDDRKNRA